MLKTFVYRSAFFVLGAAMFSAPLKAADQSPVLAQVDRGRQLFQKANNGVMCASCHSLENTGTAVGPDLKTLGSVVAPRGLSNTINMTVTCYVQEYTLANGTTFPGFEKSKAGGMVEIWDLSTSPAQLKKLKESEVTVKPNSKWKHPAATVGFDDQEMADLVAYIKAMATGNAKEVKAVELH